MRKNKHTLIFSVWGCCGIIIIQGDVRFGMRMGHTSCWVGPEVVWLLLWWTGPAVEEESDSSGWVEYLMSFPGGNQLAQNTPQLLQTAPTGKKEANTFNEWIKSIHYVQGRTHPQCIRTLLCCSSVFRLSRLLKMSSLCSSLLVLLINLKTVSLSASKFCQELRVALR